MLNTKARITQLVLALILLYLVFGDCLLFKLIAVAAGALLIYKNYVKTKNPRCRQNDCVLAPVDGVITQIEYEGDDAIIDIEPKWYMPSTVYMPQNGTLEVTDTDGAVLDHSKALAAKLNARIVYAMNNVTMQLLPSYFMAQNYARGNDSYFVGDIIGRLMYGKVRMRISGAALKVGSADEVKAKETLIAYIDEHQV
ncbi:MAG: hypothetical protein ACQERK_02415 [Campylobacterota bacterium]